MNRQFRNLGVSPANPAQYVAAFGASLVDASAIPAVSHSIRPDNGARLAAEATPLPVKLVGDVSALSLINRSGKVTSFAPYAPPVSSYLSGAVIAPENTLTHNSAVGLSAMSLRSKYIPHLRTHFVDSSVLQQRWI